MLNLGIVVTNHLKTCVKYGKICHSKLKYKRDKIKKKRIILFPHRICFRFHSFVFSGELFIPAFITLRPIASATVVVAAAITAVIIMFFSMSIDYRRMRATIQCKHYGLNINLSFLSLVHSPDFWLFSARSCSQHPRICYGINMFPTKEVEI